MGSLVGSQPVPVIGLGLRQRQLLEVIWRQGGIYPPHWRMDKARRKQLDRLVEMGALYKAMHSTGVEVYRMTVMRDPRR